MKTIKELADELGVSKTAVRKHMTEEFRAAHTANLPGNIIGIDEAGCKLLAESLRKPLQTTENKFPETPETTANQSSQDEIAFLREQLRAKDRQIEAQSAQLEMKEKEILNLTAALENMSNSVKGAQALHAGTMKQLGAGDSEGQDELVIDTEAPQAEVTESLVGVIPEQKSKFAERLKKALQILRGE